MTIHEKKKCWAKSPPLSSKDRIKSTIYMLTIEIIDIYKIYWLHIIKSV